MIDEKEIQTQMDKISRAFVKHLARAAQDDILKVLVILERQIMHQYHPSLLEHRVLMTMAKLALLQRNIHVRARVKDIAKIIGRQQNPARVAQTITHLATKGVLVPQGKGFDMPILAPFLAMLGFVGGFDKKKKGGGVSGQAEKEVTGTKQSETADATAEDLGIDECSIRAALASGED